MAEAGWPRHALDIGVFEFRRSVRTLWRDKARFGFMALGAVIPSVLIAALAILFANAIRGIETLAVSDSVRGMVAMFWLFGAFLVAQRVVSTRTHVDAEALVLTTVSARTAAVGLLIAETVGALAYVGLSVLVLTGVFAFVIGSPASLFLVPLVAVVFVATVVVAGSIAGYAAAWLVATVPFVARHRTVLGGTVSLLAMGGYFLLFYPQIGGVSQAALAWFPAGWFADIAVVGTPFGGSPTRAVGALAGSVALLVGGGRLVERVTVSLWFDEPVRPDSGTSATETRSATHSDALAAAVAPLVVPPFVSTPVRRVAEWVLLRTRRDPNRLMFLTIPVFAIGSPLVTTAVESGSIGSLAAPLLAVTLPWLVGALFAMNPLGDEGAVLPVTLTAVSGRQFVRGLTVPGLAFGLPGVLLATGIAGLVSPYTVTERLALIALGGYLTCVAVVIAPAVGMALPRFSSIRVGQSREVIPPRMAAIAVHAALTVLPGAFLAAILLAPHVARTILAGVVGFLPAIVLETLVDSSVGIADAFLGVATAIQAVELGHFRLVSGTTVLLGGVLVSWLLYRNAVSRFQRYVPT